MAEDLPPPTLTPIARPLSLIPVGLKEAALDSPTFRATALHFASQFDLIETWLKDYVKQATKLADRFAAIFQEFDGFKKYPASPPAEIGQAALDHDYTLLAATRHTEGAREYLQNVFRNFAKSKTTVVEPMNAFIKDPLRIFKDAKDTLKRCQRDFDNELAKYMSQAKTKEPSSLREDAFKVHEARKAYLKASMDFCIQAPNFRAALDRMLVTVFSDQWKDFRSSREATAANVARWGSEMERIRGWSKEMEQSEPAFKRELLLARRHIEESAEQLVRPSRELDDYSTFTVPFLASGQGFQSPTKPDHDYGISSDSTDPQKMEKQGWLFLKSMAPRPTRVTWSRRWFFVKNGIFGWLIHGYESGGVEESEKVGVLLCSIRPTLQEERRFCFEVKTKDTTIILQAESQQELLQWLTAFDLAKRRALDDPASTDGSRLAPGANAAFAITPPIAPEFAAKERDGHMIHPSEDLSGLAVPEGGAPSTRASFDVAHPRRSTMLEGESGRDHAARIMQKLDIHRRGTANSSSSAATGGIASLISASHNILPVGPGQPRTEQHRAVTMPVSSFAPSTLANPPALTNLSERAVALGSERGANQGDRSGGTSTPNGILANLWGSTNWSYINTLTRDDSSNLLIAQPPSPTPLPKALGPGMRTLSTDDLGVMDGEDGPPKDFRRPSRGGNSISPSRLAAHRKTLSVGNTLETSEDRTKKAIEDEISHDYPLSLKVDDALALKAHDAQFRMLFQGVPRSEKVVLVFTAMWNPNEQQEFPGRIYVTPQKFYFYSNHFGMVLITELRLATVNEVTAAPGRHGECDYLFLHLKDNPKQPDWRRITVKTFLTNLNLLQRRLDFLVRNANSPSPVSLDEVFKTIARIDAEDARRSPSPHAWDDMGPSDDEGEDRTRSKSKDIKRTLRVDNTLYGAQVARTGREITKFKLPAQPVVYRPSDMGDATAVKDFQISAKALFHVMFGDRSAVFQILYQNRHVQNVSQSPWSQASVKSATTRQITSLRGSIKETDTQTIDVQNEHLCYVISYNQCIWHLPLARTFHLLTKFVITHSAKSKCKLAVFNKVVWHAGTTKRTLAESLVQKQALREYEADAIDLMAVIVDQVSKLGVHTKTNKAVQIFGAVGQSTQTTTVASADMPTSALPRTRKAVRSRTLMNLYTDELLAQLFKIFTMVLDVAIALAKSVAGLASAHTLLLGLLVVSAAYNSWYGYRDGMTWYRDRQAGKYMARLGVRSDSYIARAVYLSDVEDFIAPHTSLTGGNETGVVWTTSDNKTCRSTFGEILVSSDPDITSPLPVGGAFGPRGTTKRAEGRLHRSRQSLARYRHDMLVAMRVINRIEEEVVQAEWEEWIREEVQKCKRVDEMLSEKRRAGSKAGKSVKDTEGLGEEFDEYCRSCRMEAARVRGDA